MLGQMMDVPLTVELLRRRADRLHRERSVVTNGVNTVRRSTLGEVLDRADRLAHALRGLGVERGDRVATLAWNQQEHVEAYIAVPCMGAVLHTLNLRLFPEQLAFVINDADDKIIIVDKTLIPILNRVAGKIPGAFIPCTAAIGSLSTSTDCTWASGTRRSPCSASAFSTRVSSITRSSPSTRTVAMRTSYSRSRPGFRKRPRADDRGG